MPGSTLIISVLKTEILPLEALIFKQVYCLDKPSTGFHIDKISAFYPFSRSQGWSRQVCLTTENISFSDRFFDVTREGMRRAYSELLLS